MTQTSYYGGTDAPLSPTQLKGGQPNVTGGERWISILVGGTVATWGAKRGGALGAIAAVTGGALIARGATGQGPVKRLFQPTPYERKVADEQGWSTAATAGSKVSINRPRQEVYDFYRRFSNLPKFMENVESIEEIDDMRSHWRVKAPGGQTVEWTSTIVEDVPGEKLVWQSEGTPRNAGTMLFKDGPGGRGTEVGVTIAYEPPFGQFGRIAAKLSRVEPAVQARQDLKRFKMLMETGEVATGANRKGGPGEK